jgi:hypothetical protein
MWLIVNCKSGISRYEVSRDLGVSQKSAWHMLHRIRLAMQDQLTGGMMGGDVDVNEWTELLAGLEFELARDPELFEK